MIPPLSDQLILLAVTAVIPATFLPLQQRRRQVSGADEGLIGGAVPRGANQRVTLL